MINIVQQMGVVIFFVILFRLSIKKRMINELLETQNPLKFQGVSCGATDQSRTGDLILTKDALYLLSYISRRQKIL